MAHAIVVPAPPGPPGGRWSGNVAAYEEDRLGFLLRSRDEFGGVVSFDSRTTVINDPGLALEAMADHKSFSIRANFLNQRLDDTTVAATTARRRHLNPGLRTAATAGAGTSTTRNVKSTILSATQGRSTPIVLDPVPVLEKALSTTVNEYFFGGNIELGSLVQELLNQLSRIFGNVLSLPAWVPTKRQRRIGELHDELRHRIGHSLTRPQLASNHLTYAQAVASACRGAGESQAATVDLLIGALLAAQRVPAAATAWALYAIAENRSLQDELRATVATPRVPDAETRELTSSLLERTLLESLRLNPPTWMMQRTVSRQTELGGYRFTPGHHVLISPYVIHRAAAVFERPFLFRPDRWLHPAPRPFIPFGQGIRACPGTNLAMVMMGAAIHSIISEWDLSVVGRSPTPDARSTLIPKGSSLSLTPAATAVGTRSPRAG